MTPITSLIIASVAIAIFVAYNIILIAMYGVPQSLSHTFYYLKEHGHSGWWFTAMMWIVCGLLIAPWITINHGISDWSHYLDCLPFLTCAALLFSSLAGNARDNETTKQVHLIGARFAAVTAILWICVCCWKIMYVIPILILLIGAIAHLTKTAKFGRDYWIEWVAFGPTFTAIIWEAILQL